MDSHDIPLCEPDRDVDAVADNASQADNSTGPDYSPEALERYAREQGRALDAARPGGQSDAGARKPATAPDWQPPRELPEPPLWPVPAFDYQLLPSDFRVYVQDVAERMQVAPDLVAVAIMAALGIVATNARTIYPKRFDNWRVYTNLWGVVIAPAGSLKSPALKTAEHFLDKLEAQERELHKQRVLDAEADKLIIASDRKALQAKINSAAKPTKATAAKPADAPIGVDRAEVAAALRQLDERESQAKPILRRLKMTDTTVEAMLDRVQRGERRSMPVIVWRDEVMALLASFDREGHEADRKVYLEGWTVKNTTIDRVGRGTQHAKDFACSVFGGATPGALAPYVREATTDGSGADGFLQRMQLLVYPDPLPLWRYVDRSPDRMAETRAFAVFERLYALDEDDSDGKPPGLHFESEAQEFFDEWLAELERRLRDDRTGWDTEARKSHFGKYRSLMPALALLCHLASGPGTENSLVTVHAALLGAMWCDYLERHAERVYALRDRSIEQRIVDWIKSGKLTGEIGVRQLHRLHFDHRYKAEELNIALAELEHLGWVRLVKRETRGRPLTMVLFNPRGAKQ